MLHKHTLSLKEECILYTHTEPEPRYSTHARKTVDNTSETMHGMPGDKCPMLLSPLFYPIQHLGFRVSEISLGSMIVHTNVFQVWR